ncbi:MAG: thioredoxin [Sulfuricurvum sp. RIFOXYD2_FULL_44_160]|uniref:Thioredoxin n=1 Tax=Sulfuricurvum kujiense TaxID=148813 RepID=A0A2D3WNR4_9BACT|nr:MULTISPECIES: thioredoxin family protein [Sulfuricurvum]OHD93852.1 MAG: thioredoxin [Sulfuricurvum sp. RIFOXYD12_FULL_44_77]OHD98326.1 MAG: thioredoxin [Sulfuricurvum sp. RIFOXYD2_FULL_44_160]DAB39394.1 MAG TPA: thioredoxin [Sulfuricurvum kujiense]
MSKIILALAVMASCAFAELKWAVSYDAALAQAAKEKKKVMVMLSKENCPACEYMNDVVFEENAVANEIHKSFVPVHIDIHKDFIPEGLGYIGTPTFHFLDAKGKKIGRHDGGANIPTFMGILGKYKK